MFLKILAIILFTAAIIPAQNRNDINNRYMLAQNYLQAGQYQKAEPLFREAAGIARTAQAEESPQRLRVQINLGYALLMQERYGEAESLLLESGNAAMRILGPNHPVSQYGVSLLVHLYESWGKPDQAREWSMKLKLQ